jgi:hypothetical protein
MKRGIGLRFGLATLLVAGVYAVSVPGAQAQGGPGGGFQMPPEMRAKIAAWQKFREQHKNLSTLGDMLYQIQEMNKEAGYQLDKKQSASMLKIISPWRTKTTMNEDQAKNVSKQMGAILTVKQLKKMSTIQPPGRRFRGGGGGPGGGRPGGPGGPGGGGFAGGRPGGPGGRPGGFQMPDPPKQGWNPFNPDSLPFERMRPMAKTRMDEFVAALNKQAKG